MLTTPKSWLTSSHVCGHVTRATWHLKVPGDRSFAVDDFRHWNFSIWSTNKGVMVILVKGYNEKNASFWGGPIIMQFIDFLGIYPSTKMAITPLLGGNFNIGTRYIPIWLLFINTYFFHTIPIPLFPFGMFWIGMIFPLVFQNILLRYYTIRTSFIYVVN